MSFNISTVQTLALRGGKYNDGTVAATAADNYIFLVVNQDAVFTTLTDQDDTDLIAEWGISGKTISQGMVIAAASGKALKSIVMASGSVLLIKG